MIWLLMHRYRKKFINLALILGGFAFLLIGFVTQQRNIGAQKAVKKIERVQHERIKKGRGAVRGAHRSGSAERLRKEYCRDC